MRYTDVSLITVTYNTEALIRKALESIWYNCGQQNIYVVDGSDISNPCYDYLNKIKPDWLTVNHIGYNIGHGRGLDLAIGRVSTPYALIFDSDIEILEDPIGRMRGMMGSDTYGVGWITEIGRDGYDYGTWAAHKKEPPIKYLHPYFALINVEQYRRHKPLCHHGAPFYKAMVDLHDCGEAWRLKQFDGLTGHTSGEGINWIGKPSRWVRHDFGGTRAANKASGKKEIEGTWER